MSVFKKFRRAAANAAQSVSRWRTCRFEQMEPRQLLSATVPTPDPIQIGAVYYEAASGDDSVANTFTITWNGGAPGTQLTELVIDTDKQGNGMSMGDCLFDTAPGGLGAYGSSPFHLVSSDGIQSVSADVVDGGTKLTLHFAGFDAGEKLVFTIDVDEMSFLSPNAVAEGAEFEGSQMTGTFASPHYFEAQGTDIFYDAFNTQLAQSGLNLPNDGYMPPSNTSLSDYTAAAIFPLEQTPLPITLSGNVYEDNNVDNVRQSGELGIGGVALSLYEFDGTQYVDTGMNTITAGDGSYSFENILPGTYQVRESQPAGYLSVGATAGTVAGLTRGAVISSDILGEITLLGGEDSIRNDFAEAKPASLSGHVYHDANNNGVFDAGEIGIGGVTLYVVRASTSGPALPPIPVVTAADGTWSVSGLMPGNYQVTEFQPTGWLDGIDRPGNAGGTPHNPGDMIDGIGLVSSQSGINYDFGELLPGSISGRVIANFVGNCAYEPGDLLLPNVTIQLLDASGNVIRTTTTDTNGEYAFTNLPLGIYGVHEIQPTAYLDGPDHVGTAGGTLAPDSVVQISLASGVSGQHYDFCEVPPVSVAGFVYSDLNNNGVMDAGEAGIGGVLVALLNSDGTATGKSMTTEANGAYYFGNLRPGVYGVQETQPAGWLDGLDTAGSVGGTAHNPGDLIDIIPLTGGINGVNYNFGEIKPASISGNVHAELDGDCVRDANEPWLAGVTVYLLDSSGNRIASTTTDQNGAYSFGNLLPGKYGIEEIQPAAYLDGDEHVGTVAGQLDGAVGGDDLLSQVILTAGDNGVNYNFCELIPASISGYVFQDGPAIQYKQGDPMPDIYSLRFGNLKADDIRLSGVRLQLGDASGAPLLDAKGKPYMVVTDANGYYEFKMLPPGVYTVLETQPTGYLRGINTAGTAGGLAIGPTSKIDPMILSTLAIGTESDAIVRITLTSGVSATNYNFAEVVVRTTTDPPKYGYDIPRTSPTIPIVPLPPMPAQYAHFSPITAISAPPPGMFGGSGGPGGNTWHLSVIDGGNPRRKDAGVEFAPNPSMAFFDPVAWKGVDLGQSQWIVADLDGKVFKTYAFGMKKGIPVAGDFNGDGLAEVAVFVDGQWFIDLNGDGVWDDGDLWVRLGQTTDLPVVGDWNGDGKADIGTFGPSWIGDVQAIAAEPGLPATVNHTLGKMKNMPPEPKDAALGYRTMKRTSEGKLRSDLIDHVFQFGVEGDIPLAGDWTGDGVRKIGVFRDGVYFIDMDGDGRWSPGDVLAEFGQPGDLPVVGDWTGDGISKLGVYRNGKFMLDIDNNRRIDATDKIFALGVSGDKPVAADFNGDGVDEVAVYHEGTSASTQTAAK